MYRGSSRRQFLGTVTTVGTLMVAGCSESSDTADEPSGSTDETTAGSQGGATGGVDFDLQFEVTDNYSDISSFDSLLVRFDAFELRPVEGDAVRREGDGRELDMAAIVGDDPLTLLETTVPAGEYTEAALGMPVLSYSTVDGEDESLPIENTSPTIIDLELPTAYQIESGASITFTANTSVRYTLSQDAWKLSAGYSSTS